MSTLEQQKNKIKKERDTLVCWKCRWIVHKTGFLKRKKNSGPCDRCLGQLTTFQIAWERDIWIRQLPEKKKEPPKKNGGQLENRKTL